jgi:FKBP-type peptidyl-prolyl cis-trans isomerase SlyD
MAIEANKVVTLSYTLTDHKSGEKIEETSAERPMVFLFGVGGLVPEFEMNISGKNIGDKFKFTILAENAYGKKTVEDVAKIPIDSFLNEDGELEDEFVFVGANLPMSDNEGNEMEGTVLSITKEYVEMDFGHPLAGTDLSFEGEILGIREATQEELNHGHVHGEGGHHH